MPQSVEKRNLTVCLDDLFGSRGPGSRTGRLVRQSACREALELAAVVLPLIRI